MFFLIWVYINEEVKKRGKLMEDMMIGFSLLVLIGALSQLLAWRFDFPAILIMTVAGMQIQSMDICIF